MPKTTELELTKANKETGRRRYGRTTGKKYKDPQGHICVAVTWDDLPLRGPVDQRTATGLGNFEVNISPVG